MQRTLILMRHAKATNERRSGDLSRELTGDGRADASEIRERLTKANIRPDRVLCSTSVRTVETASLVVEPSVGEESVMELPELYLADPMTIVRTIAEYGADATRLMIVGHNPAIESIIQSIDPAVDRLRPGTALVCSVDEDLPWHEFSPGAATAKQLLIPSRYSGKR